jgi:hypothetical protein
MYTEDDLGAALLDGSMTVAEAVELFQGDDVVVYPPVGVAEGTETWADVEDMGAGSTIFHDLHKAGATDEQRVEIGTQIERLRATGRTLDKVYGWSTEAMTPEGTPESRTLNPSAELAEPAPGEGSPQQSV